MVVSDSGGETLLHYAAFHGQDKILEWLLERVRTTDDATDVGEWGHRAVCCAACLSAWGLTPSR